MNKNNDLRSSAAKRRLRESLAGLAFVSPFIIGFVLFILSPLVMYVVMSFSKLTLNDEGAMVFNNVGFKNYINVFFKQTDFIKNLIDSLTDFLIRCPSILFFSLFIAIVLNQKFKGRAAVRAIFFLPVLVYSGAAMMFSNDALSVDFFKLLSSDGDGKVNLAGAVISVLGGTEESPLLDVVTWLMDAMYEIVCASGVQILIYLAGLQSISPQLYEVSAVEGCTGWESFWKITLPMISPMILVNTIYTVIEILGSSENNIINKMYNLAMSSGNYGLSSAMGLIYFSIIFIILGVAFLIVNRFVFYEENI